MDTFGNQVTTQSQKRPHGLLGELYRSKFGSRQSFAVLKSLKQNQPGCVWVHLNKNGVLIMLNWFKSIAALATVALVSACGGGEDGPHPATSNIVQTAQANAQFSILVEAVTAADLGTTLSGTGPFTVFAPTNDAFAKLLTELNITKAALLANKPLLTSVLTYHVLPSQVLKAAVPAGQAIKTVQGGIFKVDAKGTGLVITDGRNRTSNITATDILTSNGVIHSIDTVLLPADKNIVQTAVASAPEFSILVEAVTAADLGATLSGTGPFTVFAPTNAAFAKLLTELNITKAALLANKPLLTSVLTYHVLPSQVLKAAVPAGLPITTVQGDIFKVDAKTAGLVITDGRNRTSNITATDILTSNGVIHSIDTVLLPADKNIVQTAVSLAPEFSILVEAVTAANLGGTLSGTGPFTVFAPTNAAFAAALTELGLTKAQLLANVPLLTKVLTYHVVPARVLKAAVPVAAPITTVQGETFTVSAAFAITDKRARVANITSTDVLASNGVIHVIDKVILPAP
jgi:uncharacterized surface protein with fasciclin (FAS1) repeats